MNIETYAFSLEDVQRVKPKEEMLKVSGDGVFATFQGEGFTAGSPSVFLRLHYCNLTCGQLQGWKCDTEYTWNTVAPEFWQEPQDWSYKDAVTKIIEAWKNRFPDINEKRLVVTGGEPLIQQKKLADLLRVLPEEWLVEIETNATIMPITELWKHQFNCSPKLKNSGNNLNRRYKPEILRLLNTVPKSQFKFVVAEPSDLEEIDQIVKTCKLNPGKILIMPEGLTAEAVEEHKKLIESEVQTRGWDITLRNQLIWYGSKRRT